MKGPIVLRILEAYAPSPYEGQFVVRYEPEPLPPVLVTSLDPNDALQFKDITEALELWRKPSGRTREDGKPDRPLTAWTVEPMSLADALLVMVLDLQNKRYTS